jgi:CheY-like chemotaxis protein
MQKEFHIVIVDDNPDTLDTILKTVKSSLRINYNYEINYTILSKRKEVDKLNDYVCDIVMFDCALSGEDYNFQDNAEARYGFELIKKYRKKNKRTKIIFYSGSFDFEDEGSFDLSIKDFVQIINELNIFAITNRNVKRLVDVIKKAIDELDTVLISLEDLIYRYGEDGYFFVSDQRISSQDLLNEIRLGTQVGEKFREEVYSTILSYFMKFGDED